MTFRDSPHPLGFFGLLKWIDDRPLLDTVEPYRREILSHVLYDFDGGRPRFNFALTGRGKKNSKTSDLVLACLYRLVAWQSPAGNDCYVLANDEGQAADDLKLAKLIVAANPDLRREVEVRTKDIVRKDGRGLLAILPARDSAGVHGKTYSICGFDEIHAYRNYDLFEALSQDPTRHDALTWVTSYNAMNAKAGVPIFDFLQQGKAGEDPRMFFSWYAGDYTTDPALAEAEPEARANPSMASWGNDGYLAQQKRRLPTHRYRRLHLNLPGAPDGAAFDADKIMACVISGRRHLAPEPGCRLFASVDMSGGSKDDAVLAIATVDEAGRGVLVRVVQQTGKPPFDPRAAVVKFAGVLKEYGIARVHGDAYGGQTFQLDFQREGIVYEVDTRSASDLYEAIEPAINAGTLELLDDPKLIDQWVSLIWRGNKIDHQGGAHDDYVTAAASALLGVTERASRALVISDEVLAWARQPGPQTRRFSRPIGARRSW